MTLIASTTGCVPRRTTTTPTGAPTISDTDRIAALESKVSQLQSKIASLPPSTDTKGLEKEIDSVRDELTDLADQLSDQQAEINSLQAAIVALQTAQTAATAAKTQTSSNTSPEDAVEVSVTQPYTAYTVAELAVGATANINFMLTMSLENTLAQPVKNVVIMLTIYPQASRTGYTMTTTTAGSILFTQYAANTFQSWGPISLKAGQKRTYQLSVNILLENKTAAIIQSGTLTTPVQAYCIDYE